MSGDINVQTLGVLVCVNTQIHMHIRCQTVLFCNQLPKGRFRVGTPNAFADIDSICRKSANLYVYSKQNFEQIKLPAKLLDYFSWSNKYTYLYTYLYTYMYIYIYLYTYIHAYIYTYIIYKYVHMYVYIDIYIYTCIYMYVCVACVRVYVYIYTYLFIVWNRLSKELPRGGLVVNIDKTANATPLPHGVSLSLYSEREREREE